MTPARPPTTLPVNPAPRLGLLFGAILGLLSLPTIAFVALRGGYVFNGGVLLVIFLIVAFALCFVAGLLAARRTGQVGSGAVTGLIAGAVATLIALCLGTVILLLLAPYLELHAIQAARAAGGALGRARRPGLVANIVRLAFGGVIVTVVTLLAGTLGALVGRVGVRPTTGAGPTAHLAGYTTGYGAPTSASQMTPGARAYQTPLPQRANPSPVDQSDYAISYPAQGTYSTQPTILEPYRGDDPTTPLPYPLSPTPTPDEPPPATPSPSIW